MKRKLLSILLCVAMTASLLVTAIPAVTANGDVLPFVDVPANEWYVDSVRFVWERGIMNGTSATTFGPEESMTRGQIVTILSRMSGDDVTGMKKEMAFKDVNKDEYYADPIGWAVKNGIAKGMSTTTFEPETPVLRQEFAAFFVRYMNYKGIKLPDVDNIKPFPDKNEFPDWAVNDIEALQKTGLVKGDNIGKFNPGNQMTRAEIATVVMRFVELIEKEAADPMHAALEAFLDEYTCVTHQDVIHMTVYGGGQYETALRTVPLDAMGLDPEVYEMCFDNDQLEAAKGNCSGQGNGYGGGGEITFWVRNKNTGEET
ncbi:MAG: S-layer homology domain-containing protein, partial [Clostridia bacterium]|nr:S-layer homology domain-containing protein [Clostridia bacterium]